LNLSIGLVGCGRWGSNVLRDLRSLDVTVLVADSDAQSRAWARARGATVAVSTAEDLPECDGYVVVTPAGTHREVCENLLDRGAPVYVEKPPCTSVTDVESLIAHAHGRLVVMHKWRYHPGVLAIRELVARGALGEPTMLETTRIGPQTLPPDVEVTWHLVVHDLAIALELLESVPRVRTADGDLDRAGRLVRCRATLDTEAGVEHHLVAAAGERDNLRRVRLLGTDRTALLASPNATVVSVSARDGSEEAIALPSDMPLERELAAFVAHCNGGPAPKSSGADALTICEQLAVIDALVHSTP
jgi:predicted dehydrogenase